MFPDSSFFVPQFFFCPQGVDFSGRRRWLYNRIELFVDGGSRKSNRNREATLVPICPPETPFGRVIRVDRDGYFANLPGVPSTRRRGSRRLRG